MRRRFLSCAAFALCVAAVFVPGDVLAKKRRAQKIEERLRAISLKNPLYVRISELSDVDRVLFASPTGLQVTRLGGARIRLEPGVRYLWVIDEKNLLYIAPEAPLPETGGEVGHTNLLGGRPGRLGGMLIPRRITRKKGKRGKRGKVKVTAHYELNTDSGRFGYKHPDIAEKDLRTAAALFAEIGFERVRKGRVELERQFVTPLAADADKREEAAEIARFAAAGGYTLRADKDGTPEQLPSRYRLPAGQLHWGRRARFRLGLATPADVAHREALRAARKGRGRR